MIGAGAKEYGDAEVVVVSKSQDSCWARRTRIGKAAHERGNNPNRVPALEASIRAYADNKAGIVVNPAVGTCFNSVEEAYEFYNLYSWDTGLGVRYAKSRLNVHRIKCMQEIVCACAGKSLQSNSRSTRCGCTAMMRILRLDDKGWYVCEHRSEHNHELC